MELSNKTMSQRQQAMVAYLPATTVLVELNQMASELAEVSVTPDQTTVGGSFVEWSAQLEAGQTAWLYSLEQFRSITELMAYYESMRERGVEVRSVREPWFNAPNITGSEVLGYLFRLGEQMHRYAWPISPSVARRSSEGSSGLSVQAVVKVKRAVELRVTRNMSVVAACRMAGCGVNVYYRYLKEQQKGVCNG